jgi:hypothetical protein
MTITCRHCGNDVERTEELSASAIETGGFLCPGCLAGYRALSKVPVSSEHRGSRMPARPPEISEEMRVRIEQHLGVIR